MAQNNTRSLNLQDKQEDLIFVRPSFRVQFKKFGKSNVGDYIEYTLCIQCLEGPRQSWLIHKRYTDFVKLHQRLIPMF